MSELRSMGGVVGKGGWLKGVKQGNNCKGYKYGQWHHIRTTSFRRFQQIFVEKVVFG